MSAGIYNFSQNSGVDKSADLVFLYILFLKVERLALSYICSCIKIMRYFSKQIHLFVVY